MITRKIFLKFTRNLHRYLALIIGVQVLLWTISGLFMSFVPIKDVRGEELVQKKKFVQLQSDSVISSALNKALKSQENAGLKIIEVKIKGLLGSPVFELHSESGKKIVFDRNGERLSPFSKEMALKIAKSRYSKNSSEVNIELVKEPVLEYRAKYPVWKIDFSGSHSFYVDRDTGDLKAVRTDLWRVYDFLWMLHIMDYSERENFNNWWLIVAAFLGVMLTVTGIILLPIGFKWIRPI